MSIDEDVRPVVGIEMQIDMDAFALLGGKERDDALRTVERAIRQLSSVRTSMVQTVEVSGSYLDDAHHSIKSWLQAVLNTSEPTARELANTSALFRELPELAEAAATGAVGADQIREFTRLHTNQRCRAQLAEHGAALIDPARRLVFDHFRRAVNRWIAHADPDGTFRNHEASRANRRVGFGISGHGGRIHADGDAASIDEMVDILKAHIESEFLKDCEERKLRYGADADKHPLRRTHQQRSYDALQEIFRKAAGTGVAGVAEPCVNIITTESDLADAIRVYFGQLPLNEQSNRQRLCETEQGSPVDPNEMVVAALLGKVRSVVVAEDGRYVQSSSKQRLFTGPMRDAILLLGGHRCNRPGCNLSGPNIQVDHIESWTCHGCTTASNGGSMCPLHNRDKHRLGFTVTHDKHGWHHFRPDGTEIAPRGS